MPEFSGVSHIALTVTDLERSKDWYMDLFGVQPIMEGEQDGINFCITMHPQTGLVLGFRHFTSGSGDRFTPERTGLDHIGFQCGTKEDLEKWQATFEEKGVTYTPIVDSEYGHHLNFKDPDNIALEMFALKQG